MNWKLVRERDGLTKQSEKVMWVEFNEEGRFKEKYDEIAVGRSLLMSPFNDFFTWQTTTELKLSKRETIILSLRRKIQTTNYVSYERKRISCIRI